MPRLPGVADTTRVLTPGNTNNKIKSIIIFNEKILNFTHFEFYSTYHKIMINFANTITLISIVNNHHYLIDIANNDFDRKIN